MKISFIDVSCNIEKQNRIVTLNIKEADGFKICGQIKCYPNKVIVLLRVQYPVKAHNIHKVKTIEEKEFKTLREAKKWVREQIKSAPKKIDWIFPNIAKW